MADQAGAVDLQVVEELVQVIGKRFASRAVLDFLRQAEFAMIDRDAAKAIGEMGDLLPPGKVIAAASVQKDDGRAIAVRFVEEVDAVYRGIGYGNESLV